MGPIIAARVVEGAGEINERDLDPADVDGLLVLLVQLLAELSFPAVDVVFEAAAGLAQGETPVLLVAFGLRDGELRSAASGWASCESTISARSNGRFPSPACRCSPGLHPWYSTSLGYRHGSSPSYADRRTRLSSTVHRCRRCHRSSAPFLATTVLQTPVTCRVPMMGATNRRSQGKT